MLCQRAALHHLVPPSQGLTEVWISHWMGPHQSQAGAQNMQPLTTPWVTNSEGLNFQSFQPCNCMKLIKRKSPFMQSVGWVLEKKSNFGVLWQWAGSIKGAPWVTRCITPRVPFHKWHTPLETRNAVTFATMTALSHPTISFPSWLKNQFKSHFPLQTLTMVPMYSLLRNEVPAKDILPSPHNSQAWTNRCELHD